MGGSKLNFNCTKVNDGKPIWTTEVDKEISKRTLKEAPVDSRRVRIRYITYDEWDGEKPLWSIEEISEPETTESGSPKPGKIKELDEKFEKGRELIGFDVFDLHDIVNKIHIFDS